MKRESTDRTSDQKEPGPYKYEAPPRHSPLVLLYRREWHEYLWGDAPRYSSSGSRLGKCGGPRGRKPAAGGGAKGGRG